MLDCALRGLGWLVDDNASFLLLSHSVLFYPRASDRVSLLSMIRVSNLNGVGQALH